MKCLLPFKLPGNEIIDSTSFNYSFINFANKRIFPYLSSRTTTDNLTGLTETQTISSFDNYGNPRSIQTNKGGLTENQTISYIQKGSWIRNKPDSITTVMTYDGQSETRKIKNLYDDVSGNLTKEIINPNSTEYK